MMPQPTEVIIKKPATATSANMTAVVDVAQRNALITIERFGLLLTSDEISELIDLLEEVEETIGE